MSGKPWFRRKSIGYGVTPSTWEGWLCLLALVLVIVATVALLGDPSPARPVTAEGLTRLRTELGLTPVRLPLAARLAIVAVEVLAFWAFARTRTAPDHRA
jgi:hypothetical protein